MTKKPLPTPEELRKFLRYEPDTGKLFWRKRTPDMFVRGKMGQEVSCKRWNTRFSGKQALVQDSTTGYFCGVILDRNFKAHRVAFAIANDFWPEEVDHINGNRKDNRKENLRSVSKSENMKNVKTRSDNKSGRVGICWVTGRSKWRAEICSEGRRINIGYFENLEDAVGARQKHEKKLNFHPNHGR